MMNPTVGKGDKRRPQEVSLKEFDDNWERIFGKKRKPEEKEVHEDKATHS